MMTTLPWAPLFTIERSGVAELSISGIIAVVDGKGRVVLSVGDIDYQLWSRSCLKPWQLLAHLPVLRQAYPQLRAEHYAMMLGSHSGEPVHIEKVREALSIGNVAEELLQCPACYPLASDAANQLKAQGARQKSIYNNCSGKHSGYLLAMKAEKQDVSHYLDKNGPQFVPLRRLLAWLLGRDSEEFDVTIDGCRLPNYSLSIREMAKLYAWLTFDQPDFGFDTPSDLSPMLNEWKTLRPLMVGYPHLVGGTGRIDTRIMSGELSDHQLVSIVAKQGADGLLAIGVSPTKRFPQGLGILIKVASGFLDKHHEQIISKLFESLELKRQENVENEYNKHIQTRFHFQMPALSTIT